VASPQIAPHFLPFHGKFLKSKPPKRAQSSGTGTAQPKKTKNPHFYIRGFCFCDMASETLAFNGDEAGRFAELRRNSARKKQKPAIFLRVFCC